MTEGGLHENSSAGSQDIFLVKFNSAGTRLWTKQLGTSSIEYAYGITVDSSDNIYVTGYTGGGLDTNSNLGSDDIFLVKYNQGLSITNSDKTFTFDPSDNLTGGTTYLTRVTTGVKDAAGNAMSSQYDNSTGFTTTSSSTQMGGSIQGTELDLSTAVTTLAGSTSGTFNNPRGITTDGTNLYVADYTYHRIRKIVIDNGTVTTIAGSSEGFRDNATGTSAMFDSPWGEMTTDGTYLYMSDTDNHRIRKIE